MPLFPTYLTIIVTFGNQRPNRSQTGASSPLHYVTNVNDIRKEATKRFFGWRPSDSVGAEIVGIVRIAAAKKGEGK